MKIKKMKKNSKCLMLNHKKFIVQLDYLIVNMLNVKE